LYVVALGLLDIRDCVNYPVNILQKKEIPEEKTIKHFIAVYLKIQVGNRSTNEIVDVGEVHMSRSHVLVASASHAVKGFGQCPSRHVHRL